MTTFANFERWGESCSFKQQRVLAATVAHYLLIARFCTTYLRLTKLQKQKHRITPLIPLNLNTIFYYFLLKNVHQMQLRMRIVLSFHFGPGSSFLLFILIFIDCFGVCVPSPGSHFSPLFSPPLINKMYKYLLSLLFAYCCSTLSNFW